MKKPSLSKLTREHASSEELTALTNEMVASIGKSAPIVTAILGQSMIEDQLSKMLRSRLARKDDDTWANLTGQNGPLSSFNAKILLGHAFKLYDDAFTANLHIVRNIRNAFAHIKKLITFDHELIIAELKSVQLPLAKRSSLYRTLKHTKELEFDAHSSYALMCLALSNELFRCMVNASAAKIRRMNKRSGGVISDQKYVALANALLGYPEHGKTDFSGSFQVGQTIDPKIQALGPGLLGPLFPDATDADKKDK